MVSLVKNGDGTLKELFEKVDDNELIKADIEQLFALKFDSLTEDERITIEQITKKNEVKSFKKTLTFLQSK